MNSILLNGSNKGSEQMPILSMPNTPAPMGKNNDKATQEYASWSELIEKGDGYLTTEQSDAFQRAFDLVSKQLTTKLANKFGDDPVDFAELEALFMDDTSGSELEQDASAAAFQVLTYLANSIASETAEENQA